MREKKRVEIWEKEVRSGNGNFSSRRSRRGARGCNMGYSSPIWLGRLQKLQDGVRSICVKAMLLYLNVKYSTAAHRYTYSEQFCFFRKADRLSLFSLVAHLKQNISFLKFHNLHKLSIYYLSAWEETRCSEFGQYNMRHPSVAVQLSENTVIILLSGKLY